MKKSNALKRGLACGFALLLVGTVGLFGCAQGTTGASGGSNPADQPAEQAASSGSDEYPAIDLAAMDFDYSSRDLDPSYDEASATHIALEGGSASVEGSGAQAEGSLVTISAAGTYVVSGTLDDGQLLVEASAEDKVQLVLDGVSVRNEDGPAILVSQADKCFITLAADSTNSLSDGSSYVLAEGEDEPNAVVFSKDDLTLNGSGALQVNASYRHAVNSKDNLVITGGTYEVSAPEDALRGKDCVKIKDGSFLIQAGEDALKSNNDGEADRGFICIDGGIFDITAGDDAVHAETVLNINDGTIVVNTCEEGYEAEQVYINGANTHIVSNDDAVNASARGSSSNAMMPGGAGIGMRGDGQGAAGATSAANPCTLQINGGYLVLDAQGDGLDSNGSLEVTGGVTLLSGPTSQGDGALDFDGQGILKGGTLLVVGSAGMAQGFTELQQPMVSASVSGQAGQSVAVVDEQGKVMVSFTPAKGFQMVQASTPDLQDGATYGIVVGGVVQQANADGYASAGSVSGGATTQAVASVESQQGFGNGGGMGPQGQMGAGGGRGARDGSGPQDGMGPRDGFGARSDQGLQDAAGPQDAMPPSVEGSAQ